MEKIKVNMSPNPLDVQTIHASQNDGEARQWEFELHNNGELIDTSDVKEQMVFKSYKGGTEQILPENGSTPTTSPFLGDIKYPQGLLADQEFTYRQSPTESDGLAKITDIKGNTLVWNQFIQNGNFESTSGWSSGGNRGTLSASNNELSYTITEIGTSTELNRIQRSASFTQNHIYLLMFDFYALRNGTMLGILGGSQNVRGRQIPCVSGWNKYADILTANSTNTTAQGCFSAQTDYSVGEVVKWRNFMLIDLTQMGLDITDPSEFTSLFPLSYYSYNQGSLLSFMGNGIKTVGKNLFDGIYNNLAFANTVAQAAYYRGYTLNVSALRGKQITVSRADTTTNNRFRASFFSVEPVNLTPFQTELNNGNHYYTSDPYLFFTLTVPNEANYLLLYISNDGTEAKDLMIEIGSTPSDYEPYTSSTLSLPISTYFPSGMKSAGTVYDELTESKATARLKETTFSSISGFDSSGKLGLLGDATDAVEITRGAEVPNDKSVFETYSLSNLRNNDVNGIAQFGRTFFVRLQGKTTLAEYNTYLSANPLTVIYELATPTETSFATASLVTENAEIPLSNEDGVLIGKCTEQLSENPGFIDAKIKLSDSDGECYSNKLQLHVERKPS